MAELVVLEFMKTGLQTSVQDAGRSGWQHLGIPSGGAMDLKSLELANQLVGNSPGGPCLELTLIGPKIRMHGSGFCALTGADLSAQLNGSRVPLYETFFVENADVLSFGKCVSGCRAYLAVAGSWQVTTWLGSTCQVPYTGDLAGLPTEIKKGSEILVSNENIPRLRQEVNSLGSNLSKTIRVIPGPEASLFSEDVLNDFTRMNHVISPQSNRMGYRMQRPLKIDFALSELISSGVVPGTIQVTRTGHLIILMADAQTTGGYARLANVIQDDLSILAQKKPGDEVQFCWVTSGKGISG